MKRVLFVVNGFGLGNSTRTHAILENLSHQCQVDLCTSANSYNYFKSKTNLYQNIYKLNALTYRPGKILKALFLKSNRLAFKSNLNTLYHILTHNEYSLVVVDSDYVAPLIGKKLGLKVVSINNSINGIKRFNFSLMFKSFSQFILEGLDFLYQQMTAQYVIVPTFHQKAYLEGKYYYLPPIVRKGLSQKKEASECKRVLLLFSGASFHDYSEEVRELITQNPHINFSYVGESFWEFENLEHYNKYDNSIKLINEHDFIISNAGFSSLSEIVLSQTPALILPIEGHYEQLVNAHWVKMYSWVYTLKDLKVSGFNTLIKKTSLDEKKEEKWDNSIELASNFILGNL